MAPLPCVLVGYLVSYESIKQYCASNNLSETWYRPLLQNLESKINVPLALVHVERDEVNTNYYFCCFVDYSGRPYTPEELLAISTPPAFQQLRELIPMESGLCRLFAPRTHISSYTQSGKHRVDTHGLPIGGEFHEA